MDASRAAAGPVGLRGRVISAFGATTAIVAVDRLFHLLSTAVLARMLTPAEFGVAAAALVFVSIFSLVSQMGIGAALVQAPVLTERTITVGGTILLGSAGLLTVLGLVSAPLAGAWFRNPDVTGVVQLLLVTCMTQAIATPSNALLLRGLKGRTLSLIDLVTGLFAIGLVAIPLAIWGAGYWALAWGTIVQAVARAALLRVAARTPARLAFDWAEAKTLWGRGAGFLSTNLMQRIGDEGDRLIIGRYLAASDLGLYSRASALMTYPARFYGLILDRVAFPAFARVQLEPRRMQGAYTDALALTALMGWPLTAFLLFTGPQIILFVLGSAWIGAIAPFKILCLAIQFRLADRVNAALLRGAGRPYMMSVAQGLAAVLAVVGAYWGTRFGIAGVAGAIVVAAAVSNILLTGLALWTAGLGFASFLRTQAHGIAAALLVAAVLTPVSALTRNLELGAFASMAAAAAATGLVGLAAVLLAPAIFLGPAGRGVFQTGLAAIRASWRPRG